MKYKNMLISQSQVFSTNHHPRRATTNNFYSYSISVQYLYFCHQIYHSISSCPLVWGSQQLILFIQLIIFFIYLPSCSFYHPLISAIFLRLVFTVCSRIESLLYAFIILFYLFLGLRISLSAFLHPLIGKYEGYKITTRISISPYRQFSHFYIVQSLVYSSTVSLSTYAPPLEHILIWIDLNFCPLRTSAFC